MRENPTTQGARRAAGQWDDHPRPVVRFRDSRRIAFEMPHAVADVRRCDQVG
jgi:hypothetical protein